MKINSVTIKNVRGLRDITINLDMIPNKPSILVAPNGTGKSSFALAFQSLKPRSLKVDREEIYSNNDSFIPELIVETDSDKLVADPNKNDLSKDWAVHVINNQNKAKIINSKIAGFKTSTAKMHVAPIVLIKKIPSDVDLKNEFINKNNLQKLPKGTVPAINDLLKSRHFMAEMDISIISSLTKHQKVIDDFIIRLSAYSGTKNNIWEKIEKDDIHLLSQVPMIQNLVDYYKKVTDNKTEEKEAAIYLKTIQLIKLYLKDKKVFKQRIEYAKYILKRESCKNLFASLKGTWKEIKPREVGPNFIIEISDTDKISNGERDIIVFLAMLQQARNSLTKPNNILIIDEIFDYLDDANLIAAQYYLTEFINEIKTKKYNIFPIILSHLNPYYFKSYAFKDMKVYYLNPHKPMYSSKMEKLLSIRADLMKNDNKNDVISKYMLHFYNDYTYNMLATFRGISELNPWGDINNFKQYCREETEKYIANRNYDSIAVCVWLRECIEKYIYNCLSEEKKAEFLETHRTNKKIEFAEKNNINIGDTFSLLRVIYNNKLLHTNEPHDIDCRETLYSILENNTIRTMIKNTIESCLVK